VRGVGVFVRSDAEQLSQLAALVDSGELRVDVAERVGLAELPAVHAKVATGVLSGKVVVVVSAGSGYANAAADSERTTSSSAV
jgi:NADPH:quinone reductase-like Zn-dependent oxidoreductase